MDDRYIVCDKAAALWCPVCQANRPSFVKDSRITNSGMIRRRRVCTICNTRFTTLERTVTRMHGRAYAVSDGDADNWESTG